MAPARRVSAETRRDTGSGTFQPGRRYPLTMDGNGDGVGVETIDRWEGGLGWLAHPGEALARASHALAADGDVWVVDPVDCPGLDALLAELGAVRGVVVGLDRHKRDAAALANRHGVSVHLPRPLGRIADELDAPTTVFGAELADTGYRTITVVDNPLWAEVALHREEDGTLLVPEAVGTAPHYVVGGERLGVHPMLRLLPPRRALSALDPERVLVGHGVGVLEGASAALDDALAGSRRNAPRLYAKALAGVLGIR